MKKILLIEDNAYIRENIALMLEFAQYEVIEAPNGIKGIEKAIREKPDLIISDIMMPGTDGYTVLNTLRSLPETALIPFIFLTARSTNENMQEGLEMGAEDYLVKPFHEQELLIAVENGLTRRPTLKE